MDVYCKLINSFKYVLPTTSYPRKIINNTPHGTALGYKNYLITRDYRPRLVENISVIYKRNKNLKEMVAPSLYPKPSIKSNRTIVSCNKSDICKNFLITDSKFRCTVTGKTYFIKGNLPCDSCNVIYLITCSICREQYVVPAINIKQRFRIHKSDIKTKKNRCGTVSHFSNECCSPKNKHAYLKIQIIEQVFNNNQFNT